MTQLIMVTLCSDAPLVTQGAAAVAMAFRAEDDQPARIATPSGGRRGSCLSGGCAIMGRQSSREAGP